MVLVLLAAALLALAAVCPVRADDEAAERLALLKQRQADRAEQEKKTGSQGGCS